MIPHLCYKPHDMWAKSGLYLCLCPRSSIYQTFILEGMEQGHDGGLATCRDQVFTHSSPLPPPWSFLLHNSTPDAPLSAASLCDAPQVVRDAWLLNLAADGPEKCPYVSMACISRSFVTLLISLHQNQQTDPKARSSKECRLPAEPGQTVTVALESFYCDLCWLCLWDTEAVFRWSSTDEYFWLFFFVCVCGGCSSVKKNFNLLKSKTDFVPQHPQNVSSLIGLDNICHYQ